jgi:hypothetical protein
MTYVAPYSKQPSLLTGFQSVVASQKGLMLSLSCASLAYVAERIQGESHDRSSAKAMYMPGSDNDRSADIIRQRGAAGNSLRNAIPWAVGSASQSKATILTRLRGCVRQPASDGLTTLVQHQLRKTRLTAIRHDSAYLRKQVHRTRIRFMDSIAKGNPDHEAGHEYTDAVEQYRTTLFAEIRPYVET